MVRLGASWLLWAAYAMTCSTADNTQKPLSNGNDIKNTECSPSQYKIHIFSKSPVVIYIENFISEDERQHLQDLARGHFKHSGVADSSGKSALNAVRTSQSTTVERDHLVRCIERRALSFQGLDIPESHLEPIQLVKYAPTERFHFHTDWFTDPARAVAAEGGNRESSFFAYVHVDSVKGGGTNFPLLDIPANSNWCDRLLDCDEEYESGVTFRPIAGNAIFWSNMLEDGTGDQRTLHAGLPLISGQKIGMNIWTRQAPLSPEIRGE